MAGHGTGSTVPSVTQPREEEEVHSQDTRETRNGFMCENWLYLKYVRAVETSFCQQINSGVDWEPRVNQSAKEAVSDLNFIRFQLIPD